MEYEYKGNKYTLKDDKLALYRDANQLLIKRRELIYALDKKIDRKKVLQYQKQLKDLTNEKLILEKTKKTPERLKEVTEKINELNEQYEYDSEVFVTTKHYLEGMNDITLQIATNKNLMENYLPKILNGDCSVFDYDDFNLLKNVSAKALTDFFFVMTESSNI